jgi:hypothetical protein
MTVTTRVHDHDDTVETHYTCLERLECALCYDGLVFIGRLELTDEGEEIEVVELVPCRRCAQRS